MLNGFEDFQKVGKDNMDMVMKSFGAMSKGVQAMAVEASDYTKKSFEEGSATVEKLAGAKSIDKVMEIQMDYAKTAYEGMIGQMTKFSDMMVDLSKEAYKPYEGMLGKAAK